MRLFRILSCTLAVSILLAAYALPTAAAEPRTIRYGAEREEELISRTLKGQEALFARSYDNAWSIFGDIVRDWPDSPAGYFGQMAVLEIKMLEREDFHLEEEYKRVARVGAQKVGQLLQRYSPTSWDLFLAGSLLGLDGFFNARKGQWWDAYVKGTKSRQIFRRVKQMDHSFVDADFGLGMYLYWRSVFAKELSFLKVFIPDRRAEGISIVEHVARDGRMAKDLSHVNLGIMYMEEKRWDSAQKVFGEYVTRYPNNVILRMMLGKAFLGDKKYDGAIDQFRTIISIDPQLNKPHYFLGAALVLKGDQKGLAEAQAELTRFLAQQGGKYWPSFAHYWLGRLAEVRGEKERAKQEYGKALELNPKIGDAMTRVRAMGAGM